MAYITSLLIVSAGKVSQFVTHDVVDFIGVSAVFQTATESRPITNLMTSFLVINLFFSGAGSISSTVRMVYAMGRDGSFPFGTSISKISTKNQTPVYAILATIGLDILLVLLQLISTTAFQVITSLSTIGFQLSYLIPILLRVTYFRLKFPDCNFNLGDCGLPLGIVSCFFLGTTSILFTFPTDPDKLNWTPIILSGIGAFAAIHWYFSARHQYVK